MTAHRDKQIGGYHYRGYYFCKPEGCESWNVYNVTRGEIDFCFPLCHPGSFKECKESIDCIREEKCEMAKYKMKDLENGERWYFDSISELRREANNYTDECEGDWIPEYRVFNPSTGKFRLMVEQEIKVARLPR